jgi:hypothetical protein
LEALRLRFRDLACFGHVHSDLAELGRLLVLLSIAEEGPAILLFGAFHVAIFGSWATLLGLFSWGSAIRWRGHLMRFLAFAGGLVACYIWHVPLYNVAQYKRPCQNLKKTWKNT